MRGDAPPKIAAAKRREMALRIAMKFNRLTGTAQAIRPAYKCLKSGWRPAFDRGAWRELQFNVFNRFVNMSSIPKYARALPLILALGPVAIPAFQAAKTTAPIDPQKVQDEQDMTWADYHPIPGASWSDPSLKPSKKQFKVALIAVDFDDQPFVVTLPKHSDLFGNPQIDPVRARPSPAILRRFL